MTQQEVVWLLAEFAGVYCAGWSAGYTILFIKQISEKI